MNTKNYFIILAEMYEDLQNYGSEDFYIYFIWIIIVSKYL